MVLDALDLDNNDVCSGLAPFMTGNRNSCSLLALKTGKDYSPLEILLASSNGGGVNSTADNKPEALERQHEDFRMTLVDCAPRAAGLVAATWINTSFAKAGGTRYVLRCTLNRTMLVLTTSLPALQFLCHR